MAALFELNISSEVLQADEVCAITGCSRKADQIEWLKSNNWRHYKNKAGEPIIGRLYARMQLSGIHASLESLDSKLPQFDLVK